MQPAAGVTENVALVMPGEAARVSDELVRATVSPAPGEAGKPITVVAAPVRGVYGVTVMVPAVIAPVVSLQLTATVGVAVNIG